MPNVSDDDVREYVRSLKLLYQEGFVCACVFLVCVVIWLTTGGAFWPLWVLIAFIIKLFIRATSSGLVDGKSILGRLTCFFSPEWEEKQIKKYAKVMSAKKKSQDGTNAK
ncbi:MAG: 2TM domain-containing protein [Holosporales bacterium]|jgi:hypothetical protein|nr:2TM domain-containing protein [Holosporales bacterium]